MVVVLRGMSIDDADGLGAVHVRSWQAAYRELMPADYLASLSAEERAAMWRGRLEEGAHPGFHGMVAESDSRIIGFVLAGPAVGSEEEPPLGQLYGVEDCRFYWKPVDTVVIVAEGSSSAAWMGGSTEVARSQFALSDVGRNVGYEVWIDAKSGQNTYDAVRG